jgi:transcriptional regulator with XRE-family HTH domain
VTNLRVRELRLARRLSLRGLAAASGVHYVTIVSIEAGCISPTVSTLDKLAGALGVRVRDLIADTPPGPMTPPKKKGRRPR